MSTVEEFLISIGKELGKSPNDMKDLVDVIVKKNWYDKVESLKHISDDEWKSMGVPLRLVNAIKLRLDESNKGDLSHTTINGKNRVKEEEKWLVEYSSPSTVTITPSTMESVNNLTQIPNEAIERTISILFRIIDGILASPEDGKKRRIRINNPLFHSSIAKYSQALGVLKSVGFIYVDYYSEESDKMELYVELPIAYISLLTDCHNFLVALCKKLGISYPKIIPGNFNPYVAHFSSTNTQNMTRPLEDEFGKLQTQVKEIEALIEKGYDDYEPCLKPCIIHSSALGDFDEAIQILKQTPEYDDSDTALMTRSEVDRLKEFFSEGPTFKSRVKEYLKTLKKRSIYSHINIRVICPDKYIIQLQFKLNSTTEDLVNAVKCCLNQNILKYNWYIYETPPVVKILPKNSVTLYQCGYAPRTVLYLKVELPKDMKNKVNYLRDDLMRSIITNTAM
ncbi:hypothetical protein cand_014670 [Cryptosporidium andersoni]|uniref:PUB domain-containing protein n=1 Tax=Cryptosporidium andersoni TaxID=117008 RepID=A0A1J4MW01_9CRYT|nr:hypothetical protein cand_014670 [Cryptosporidium andersoni]